MKKLHPVALRECVAGTEAEGGGMALTSFLKFWVFLPPCQFATVESIQVACGNF